MSIKGKDENTQIKYNSGILKKTNFQSDIRAKMIYNRYFTGRTIILDDLRYLWQKDPEGCKKLVRSIVESNTDKKPESFHCNTDCTGLGKKSTEGSNEQQNYVDYKSNSDIPADILKNVPESMISIKLMIRKMNESERMDITKNLYETLELRKLVQKMKYWDDTLVDKIVRYTYEQEKEFDTLA